MGQQNVKKIDIEKEIEKAMGTAEKTKKEKPKKTADFKNKKKQVQKEITTLESKVEEVKSQLENKAEEKLEKTEAVAAEAKPKPKKIRQKKIRSKKYQELRKRVDRSRSYELEEALGLVRQLSKENFDAAVELHLKIKKAKSKDKKAKLSGTIELLNSINDQKEIKYQQDKNGNLHFTIGRKSFESLKIKENAETILNHLPISRKQIEKIVVSSTMGPGVRINLTKK